MRNDKQRHSLIKTIKLLTKNLMLPIKSLTSVQRPPILLDLLKRWAGFQCMWWWCLHVINYVFHLWNLAANYNDIGVWYREALKGKDELFLILLLWRIYIFLNMLKSFFFKIPRLNWSDEIYLWNTYLWGKKQKSMSIVFRSFQFSIQKASLVLLGEK